MTALFGNVTSALSIRYRLPTFRLVSHGRPSLVVPTSENVGVALVGVTSLYTRISLVINPDAGGAVGAGTLDTSKGVIVGVDVAAGKVVFHKSTFWSWVRARTATALAYP